MPPTQKQQISRILVHVENLTKDMSNMKISHSDMKNKQEGYIKKQDYFISILENNDKLGKTGYVKKVDDLDNRVDVLETTNKITAGKVGIALSIVLFFGGVILKALGYLKI